jgi:hypothetical protein
MIPHSYRVNNCGTVDVVLDKFVFNTPTGIKHIANLTNFGGTANFSGNTFTVTGSAIQPEEYKTFTIDYEYISGPNTCKHGNVVISSVTGKTSVIYTTIEVENPATAGLDPIIAGCSLAPAQANWRINLPSCSLAPAQANWRINLPSCSLAPVQANWTLQSTT